MAVATTLIRSGAFESSRTAEAMRMTVGQTLGDHDVRLIFAEEAVFVLLTLETSDSTARPFETLKMLGSPVYAEKESMEERGIDRLPAGVETISRAGAARMVAESGAVYIW